MRAIGLLALLQLRNAVRTTFTDLRKLLPLLFFLLLIVLQALLALLMAGLSGTVREQISDFLMANLPTVHATTFLILLLIAVGNLDFGFSTGFLTFTLADVDYLFPTPVPPKAILAYRLASKTLVTFFQAAFLFGMFIWSPIQAMAGERANWSGGGGALAALFLCLGGYANLALWLKLAFGFGKLDRLRPALFIALSGLGIYLSFSYLSGGLDGLLALSRSRPVLAVFYPCRLAADAMIAPMQGLPAHSALGLLGIFYAVTLGMVFVRSDPFYEASLEGAERAAQLMSAVRELNWSSLLTLSGVEVTARKRGTLPEGLLNAPASPAFGGRAWTLVRAHVSAAAKRPVVNFALPALGGLGLTAICSLTFSPRYASVMVGSLGAYLLFVLTLGGIATYRQTLARQPLIRPLPLPDWQVVLADVGPRIVLLSLLAWSMAVGAWALGSPHALRVAFSMAVYAPAALAPLNLIQYLLALGYPNAQDKLQQLVAGLIAFFLSGLAVSVVIPLAITPIALRLPWWACAAIFLAPCALASLVLLALAVWLYGRYEPR